MIERLKNQLNEIESFIHKGDIHKEKISQKGTYWHIDHSLKVLEGIPEVLKNSNPQDYKPKFSFIKFMIMNTGYMPRGKGRAPKQVIPEGELSKKELLLKFEKVKTNIESLKTLEKDKTFKHPLFGWLNLNDTVKFMGIHTHHHIKIIRDILK
ncbi:hypothetical protein LX97_02461 [Nonlabens dokdonensis]|jgi:hypothetical protein|uniref:DinB-like domain-containing protein n=3 Tax=Nonlabens dokdonensis TaxID=328515 RepID=L7W5T0_NONDD|nr:hypothetical protein DDD_0034 [Nonlabens dokdonensis DSW-6]PZX39095.1 hypothetical protein LX97_02461 [Nonlabens dokdonensis]